jgi:tetratricopeptide (TPR) repeat protein
VSQSGQLNLKTAVSLTDEVAAQIQPFTQMIDELSQSTSPAAEDGFVMAVSKGAWQGLRGGLQIRKESSNLLQKCDQAIQLATSAQSSDPEIVITQQQDGSQIEITPDMVIGHAHLSKGVVHLVSSNFVAAKQSLRQSLNVFPTADAQLRLGYATIGEGNRTEAMRAFQKVIDDYSDADEAIEAKKFLLQLESMKPKKWIIALILSIAFGFWGFDRFYLGYIKDGFIKLFNCGGFFVWWLVDVIKIATNSLRDTNGLKLEQ